MSKSEVEKCDDIGQQKPLAVGQSDSNSKLKLSDSDQNRNLKLLDTKTASLSKLSDVHNRNDNGLDVLNEEEIEDSNPQNSILHCMPEDLNEFVIFNDT